MKKNIFIAIALAMFSMSALAHVAVSPKKVEISEYTSQVLTFKNAHGCGESPTKSITVKIPEGVLVAKPKNVSGYELSIVKRDIQPYLDKHGNAISTVLSEVTWKGEMQNEVFEDYQLHVVFPNTPTTYFFEVHQECEVGSIDYLTTPKTSVDLPAPKVEIVQPK